MLCIKTNFGTYREEVRRIIKHRITRASLQKNFLTTKIQHKLSTTGFGQYRFGMF